MNSGPLQNAELRATKAPESLVSRLIADALPDQPFDARALLERHPELKDRKSAILDLAYEEFCHRQELGECIDIDEFAAHFPAIQHSLIRLVKVHGLLAQGSTCTSGAAADLAWPLPGQIWLGFQLIEQLGQGAFSRVFLARDQSLGNRLVVVKATMLGADEAQMLGQLEHPDIVPVHSVQRDESLGLAGIVMPFLSRVSLEQVIDAAATSSRPKSAIELLDIVSRLNSTGEQPTPTPASRWLRRWGFFEALVTIAKQLADALAYAHSQGVTHCDVKPSNVLITNDGRTKLLDFNLARQVQHAVPLIGGTLPYMAPEQIQLFTSAGKASPVALDSRVDVFGLGVTLFELAFGSHPFPVPAKHGFCSAIANEVWESRLAGAVVPHDARALGAPFAEMLLRCLAFNPDRRPSSMNELSQFFADQLSLSNQFRRWANSHRKFVKTTVAGSVVGLIVAGGWLSLRDPYPVREWHKGRACYVAGKSTSAIEHFSAALKSNPQLTDARYLRACTFFRTKNYPAAFADFELLCQDSRDWRSWAGLAHVVSIWQKDFRRAGALYGVAADRGCDSPVVLNNWGYCLLKDGQLIKAKTVLNRALAANPHLPAACHNLARAELMLSIREKRAPDTAEVNHALQICPETADLDLDAARIFAARARRDLDGDSFGQNADKMFEYLQRAVELGANNEHVRQVLSLHPPLAQDPRLSRIEEGAQSATAGSPLQSALFLPPLDEL